MNEQHETTTLNILSLEDSLLDFEIISEKLISAGYRFNISRVEMETELKDALQFNNYDIILADYNLPNFDAFQALAICNQKCPDIPFICVSGSIGEILAIELLKQGAVDYVLKDRLERLPFAIKRALDDAREKKKRKLAEEAIRQSEAELNYAQEIGNMGSWHLHLPTNKFKSSKNMARLLHREPVDENEEYFIFINHIHPDDRHLMEDNSQKITAASSGVSYELRYILDNGDTIWLQNYIRPTFWQGQLTDLHGVITDITAKKRTELDLIKAKEKAEASDRLKTSFINNISHEIRTPLNGIIGFTEVLTYPNLPAEEKDKYLTLLYNSSERLINTITNFLDISLLTTGNQSVSKKEMNPGGIISQVIEKYKNAAAQKKLTLTIDIPSNEQELKIVTDKDLLEKILNQLIDNAIKFTHKGKVTVGYRVNQDELHFFVDDSGIGIQEENKKQVFEYFMQGNSATTRGYEGSGLGLTIASGLVDLLGGKIGLVSEKDEGSTFYFSIPLDQGPPLADTKQVIQPLKTTHKQTILVAEDDQANFFYISLLLNDDSIDILHAVNGLEAVDLCKAHPEIELVLMDLKMPEMDGFEATMHIKSIRPELPVIAVSAYTGSEDQQKAFNAGCNDFITKPIKKETLLQVLQEKGMLHA